MITITGADDEVAALDSIIALYWDLVHGPTWMARGKLLQNLLSFAALPEKSQ